MLRFAAQCLLVGFKGRGIKADEYDVLGKFVLCKMRRDSGHGNFRGLLARKAVDPGCDGGKCDVAKSMGASDRQARLVAAFQ